MSKAVKCDRCGRCYDPSGVFGHMIKFRNPSVYSSSDIRGGETVTCAPFMQGKAVDAIIDLCPQCAKEFVLFMESSDILRKINTAVSGKDGV